MTNVSLPYNNSVVNIKVASENLSRIIDPNPVKTTNDAYILKQALGAPSGSVSFRDFTAQSDKLLLVVNDGTRPTPTARVLDLILPLLESKQVTFLIATGIHRAPLAEEYQRIFGKHYERFKSSIISHNSRNRADMQYSGTTPYGTRVYFNRLLTEAEYVIVIGSVEPHYFAGYSGGRKSFLPGVAAYESIEANHSFALKPGAKPLTLTHNPVHEDMDAALDLLKDKNIFSIQTVLDSEHHIHAASCGDIRCSFARAVSRAAALYAVPVKQQADIVVAAASFPLDINL
ncbi:MAG TPA: nickel-dependent lactate racemase, partial [Spirochaetota bacterium]|nr:nickel-dependent lactate racemase [Spirochaetota bacterium]